MALRDLFGKGPLSEKKIKKAAKLAANPFAQSDIRLREMQRLLDDGSEASLRAVLGRFASNAQGHIADEDEKKWLEDALVDRGEQALPPLRDFIESESKLTYALRAYRRAAGSAEAVRFFLEVLKNYGPDDYRSVDAKLQLVWQLADAVDDERVMEGLLPFMSDHSDDVRWAVMDLVDKAADSKTLTDSSQQRAAAALGEFVCSEDVGPRIQRRAAEMLVGREWRIPGDQQMLPASVLQDSFFIDKKRYLRRLVKRSG